LLTPAFALAGLGTTGPPSYETMTAAELDAFLKEMEPDIRSAERDMREIELLEKKGVTGAGKLAGMFRHLRFYFLHLLLMSFFL
jgi:hypothetical protein